MVEAKILVPLEFGGSGRTGSLSLETDADLDPGFHELPGMRGVQFPAPRGVVGFLSTARLAYRVALNHYGLSAGLSIKWRLVPVQGGNFPGLEGGSAGAAFLLALIRMRIGEFSPRTLRNHWKVQDAIEAVRLEWVAPSATIDSTGTFGPVDPDGLKLKLEALVIEYPTSRVRLAVIATNQDGIDLEPVPRMPELFEYKADTRGKLPVIRASDAADCYKKLFRLQSQQVWL